VARGPLLPTDPAQVGPYALTARLGAGGMGVVYLGAAGDGRSVAVKVLRPDLAEDPEFRTRFGREVAALARVMGVCTVRVVEADTTSPRPYLVTEYADGPSLSEYIDARGPLDPELLYGLATGLAEALTSIHAAGIVHRDLKPSNVLLTTGGPKVIDFGIAQALDATAVTRTGMTVGSAGFMAPEQIMGHAGTASDIFSWAVTVAYAASGRPPFGSGLNEAILYRIMHAEPDIAAVPASLRPHVQAALAKEPKSRPTAPELLSRLTGTGRDGSPTQTVLAQTWRPTIPGRGVPAVPRPARRRALPLPAILVLAAVLGAGGTALGFALASQQVKTNGAGSYATVSTRPAAPNTAALVSLPVLTVGSYTGLKPAQIDFSGDSGDVVTGITWASWTATSATGAGTSDIDSCVPSCAQAPSDLVPTTLKLSDPVNGRFTLITEVRNGSTETFAYPRSWPAGAS
jgi:eukaryotic-like serine/threonine-protein kinase